MRRRRAPVTSITSARLGRTEHLDDRRRRYLIAMSIRVVCLIIVSFIPTSGAVKALLIIAAVVLPWFAVIIANGGQEPGPRPAPLPARGQTALGAGRATPVWDATEERWADAPERRPA